MKTFRVTLVYSAYSHHTIEADSEEDAEAQAWARIEADNGEATSYGEWETVEIEEEQTA